MVLSILGERIILSLRRLSRLIPHIREDESDEIDSLWDTALNTDVGPSHPMTVDPVDEVNLLPCIA